MRIRAILAILVFFLSFPVISGEKDFLDKEDDISKLQNDTSKINLLIKLGRHYCSRDYEKALLYLQEALIISSEKGYRKGIAESYLWQGRAYYYKDEYNIAMDYLGKAGKIMSEEQDLEGLAYYHLATGAIRDINGNHLEAIKDYHEVINNGNILGNTFLKSIGLISLGNLHISRNEPRQAIPLLKEGLALKREISDMTGVAIVSASLGRAYEDSGNFDSALFYHNRALFIRDSLGEQRGVASSQLQLGRLFIRMGQYQKAKELLFSSRDIFKAISEKTGACLAQLELGLAMGHNKEFESAFKVLGQAADLAKELENPALKSQYYNTLASVNALNGDYESAFEFVSLHNQIDDSINEANKEKIIKELEVKFQTERKNNEIRLLKSRNRIQAKNNLILSISIAALLIILALTIILFRMKGRGLLRQKKLLEQEKIIMDQQDKIRNKEQQLLKEQLESKNRELASKALEILRINETIGSIMEKLEFLRSSNRHDEALSNSLNAVLNELEGRLKDNSWNEFERIFKNIHSGFYDKLLKLCPELSSTEIKIAALLRLNLNTKEIAAITFKSEAGIKSSRYRLRKKLGLNSDDSLVPYLIQL